MISKFQKLHATNMLWAFWVLFFFFDPVYYLISSCAQAQINFASWNLFVALPLRLWTDHHNVGTENHANIFISKFSDFIMFWWNICMFEVKWRMCGLYAYCKSDLQVHIVQNCASQKVSQYYPCDECAGVSDLQVTNGPFL